MPDESPNMKPNANTSKDPNGALDATILPNGCTIYDAATYAQVVALHSNLVHPERYILGKPHPDRARQFKPFAALRGYETLVAEATTVANIPHDFSAAEDSC